MFLNPHLWRSLQFRGGNRAASVVVSPHARFTFAASRRTATATRRSGAPEDGVVGVVKAALLSLQGAKQVRDLWMALGKCYVADGFAILLMLLG